MGFQTQALDQQWDSIACRELQAHSTASLAAPPSNHQVNLQGVTSMDAGQTTAPDKEIVQWNASSAAHQDISLINVLPKQSLITLMIVPATIQDTNSTSTPWHQHALIDDPAIFCTQHHNNKDRSPLISDKNTIDGHTMILWAHGDLAWR